MQYLKKLPISAFITQQALFGSFIAAINIHNIKLKKNQNNRFTSRYIAASLLKGWVYGSFYPIPIIGILISIQNPEEWDNHIIPLNKYGSLQDKQLK